MRKTHLAASRGLIASILVVALLGVGCASISQEAIAEINSPVDCATAEKDVAFLEDEKSGFFFRTLAVITAILPPGSFIVIGRDLFSSPDGIWTDKFRVGFGTYNDKIDEKIERTRQECASAEAPTDAPGDPSSDSAEPPAESDTDPT
jgi:hypothetical protein